MNVWLLMCGLMLALPGEKSWPQFRGPGGQGITTARGLPTTWSEKSNVVWKMAIPGRGWSSPVILGNRIWLTTATEDGKSLRALCLHRDSGKILQNIEVLALPRAMGIHKKNSHASPTPIVESGRLYVHFGPAGTACLDTQSGKVLWKRTDFRKGVGGQQGPSPVVHNKLLILPFDGSRQQFVLAVDKASGKTVWQQKRSLPLRDNTLYHRAFCTPLIVRVGKEWQLISPGPDQLHAYNPMSGREIWHVRYLGFATVPRPVCDGKHLYVVTGYGRPTQLLSIRLDPGARGDITKTHVRWSTRRAVPRVPSLVVADGRLFMVSDKGIASCLDTRTGKSLWQRRLRGEYSGSLLCGDGKVYFASEGGHITVMAAEDKPRVLAQQTMPGRIFASFAVAENALFIRTDTHLYRIEQNSENPR